MIFFFHSLFSLSDDGIFPFSKLFYTGHLVVLAELNIFVQIVVFFTFLMLLFLSFFSLTFSWLVECVCGAKSTKHGTTYVKLEAKKKSEENERKREREEYKLAEDQQ